MTSNVDKVLREKIDKLQQKWDEIAKKKDWTGLVDGLYSANAKMVPPSGQTIVGKDAIKAFLESHFSSPPVQVTKIEEVNGEGDWAYARGTYKLTDGNADTDAGKVLTVWRKAGADYQIWASIWNSSKKA